ncbi:MAG: hypothetical protein Q7N50_10815 [Armatimonadota bacterium]|nr:hypothetical protein [Armatimonadota bacterium]
MQEIAEVENALIDGYPPATLIGSHKKTALRIASNRLNVDTQSMRRRIGTPDQPGTFWVKFKLKVDWGLYRSSAQDISPSTDNVGQPEKAAEPPSDPIQVRRLKDEVKLLRSSLGAAERRAAGAEDLRSSVMGLASERLIPSSFQAKNNDGISRAETAILVLSDFHFGEFVSREELDGLNAYDPEIATARLTRVFQTAASLLTKYWPGPPPDRLIIAMLGDSISGSLHPELTRTDKMRPMESVRAVSGVLAGGIDLMLKTVPCPIDIISVVGNHGRVALPKPESKGPAVESYDTLVSDFLEMHYRHNQRVTFYVPPGPDALVSVYNYRLLFTHGDRLSAGGGRGFVGAELPILRGFQKTYMDYAMRGIILHHIFCGHYHTPLSASIGTANGCLPGPSEYSITFRMRPSPPMQAFVTIHPEHFITQTRWIKPAIPEEGTLYLPPPIADDIRPKYRVRAVSVKV